MFETTAFNAGEIFKSGEEVDGSESAVPIRCIKQKSLPKALSDDAATQQWVATQRFTGRERTFLSIPNSEGGLKAVAFGLGDGNGGHPSGPSTLLAGLLPQKLNSGLYYFDNDVRADENAAIAWGLGSYTFRRYKTAADVNLSPPKLRLDSAINADRVQSTVEGVWLGRDLINTPASDLSPEDMEGAVRMLAKRHGAEVTSVVGDDLLEKNFPLIHAVGRASPRAPRLIELNWGQEGNPSITLVGKGITFDTGGLDLKPPSAMLLMKKDMAGSAALLALAHMIMSEKIKCRLRVLIASAENSVSGDAFRPGDVLASRSGKTVEVGNTDAEGRLVLADAISLADEGAPETLMTFATLTGAARSALGPDLPAFFTDCDEMGQSLPPLAADVGDPVWRMPLWAPYDRHLSSDVADMNNIWASPFAGAITAALFLKRFVEKAKKFAHFDLYGWQPQSTPLGPKGGEPQTARAVMAYLRKTIAVTS